MSDKLCVLLVDDDHKMVKTLIDILKVEGYEVKAAYSALEALEQMAEVQFDCVLSDIKMPDLNGVELYRAIKARQPDLPVVLMTAYFDDKLVKEGLEEGVYTCLYKPFEIEDLIRLLTDISHQISR